MEIDTYFKYNGTTFWSVWDDINALEDSDGNVITCNHPYGAPALDEQKIDIGCLRIALFIAFSILTVGYYWRSC
jgi:hypothetical protein